ncbi:hypothetical protein PoB_004411600 [Plakobranchus ocellatus]|uniref:Uncharacterized protein n=1 Tax=Plakobranchus ocellatus TaxID=259542 RepID=A0AAV4BFM2_9GAST|nr:hypothetical protein PoB_004411600 [Plakobranchus ocellatus]
MFRTAEPYLDLHTNHSVKIVLTMLVEGARICETKRRPTLEAAVHVSSNTCLETLWFLWLREHTKSASTFILSKRRSYPLCFTDWSYVSPSVG